MILCVGLIADETFCHTLRALRRSGAAFDVVDFAQLACAGDAELSGSGEAEGTLALHGATYRLECYRRVYVRLLDVSDAAPRPDLRTRAVGLYRALTTWLTHTPTPVLNPPLVDNSNFSKLYHAVAAARRVGWTIPRSCLTNNREKALEFVASCPDGVVFKGTSAAKTWATLYDPARHEARLSALAATPVLFQERITGPDVRLHVVGDQAFAECIESASLDYRTVRGNSCRRIEPPASIAAGGVALAAESRLPLLGIDFKVDRRTGQWFFLEANTLPCYEAYDRRAGGAISRAIVRWLEAS